MKHAIQAQALKAPRSAATRPVSDIARRAWLAAIGSKRPRTVDIGA